ncbi:MAG: DciA family protein [Planctomycetota bacterium]
MSETPDQQAARRHVEALRDRRVRPEPDRSLGFLADQFKRDVARPFKQLGDLAALWEELLPADVVAGTRLESLQRGVLSVAVDSSARLYEVDRRLREGLEAELITRHKGTAFRKVKLRVEASGWDEK